MNNDPKYTLEEVCLDIEMSDASYIYVEGDDDLSIYNNIYEFKFKEIQKPTIIAAEESTNPGCNAIIKLAKEYIEKYKNDKIDDKLRFILDGDARNKYRKEHTKIIDKTLVKLKRYSIESYFICYEAVEYYYSFLNQSSTHPNIKFILNNVFQFTLKYVERIVPVAFQAYTNESNKSSDLISYKDIPNKACNKAMIKECNRKHGTLLEICAKNGWIYSDKFPLEFIKGKWSIFAFSQGLLDSHKHSMSFCKKGIKLKKCECSTLHCQLRKKHNVKDPSSLASVLLSHPSNAAVDMLIEEINLRLS